MRLVSNAVKFTQSGGTVTLRLDRQAGNAMVEVEDTGMGMSPEGVKIALTPFGQVDSRLARKYEGTGLGLPLAKSLIELHGGTLSIDSELQKGTTVRIYLPDAHTGEFTAPMAVAS
jgi:signal transduction histidine kinase